GGALTAGTVSEPDFRDLQSADQSFTHLSASAIFVRPLAFPSATQTVMGGAVDGSYFATLGVTVALGRAVQQADDDRGERVVVLSHGVWRTRFSSDPRVIGGTVAISGERFEIVGVAPASFAGPRPWPLASQIWIPLRTESRLSESSRPFTPPRLTAR